MQIFINKLLIPNRFLPPDNYRDKALITSFGFVPVGMTLFIRRLRQMRRGHLQNILLCPRRICLLTP